MCLYIIFLQYAGKLSIFGLLVTILSNTEFIFPWRDKRIGNGSVLSMSSHGVTAIGMTYSL